MDPLGEDEDKTMVEVQRLNSTVGLQILLVTVLYTGTLWNGHAGK